MSAMVQPPPPPPPPVEPPPPPNTCLPVSTGQTYSSTSFNSVVTHSYIQPTAVPSAVPVIQMPDSTWVSSVAVQSPIPAPIPISTQTPVSESQQSKIKDAAKTPKSAAKPANVEEKTLEEASDLSLVSSHAAALGGSLDVYFVAACLRYPIIGSTETSEAAKIWWSV